MANYIYEDKKIKQVLVSAGSFIRLPMQENLPELIGKTKIYQDIRHLMHDHVGECIIHKGKFYVIVDAGNFWGFYHKNKVYAQLP